MKSKKHLTFSLCAFIAASAFFTQPATSEAIYRGLLEGGHGVLDLRENRFNFGGGGLSFNKDMAQIMAAPQNFNCALMLDTTNPIPVVGNQSAINQFPGFDATFDQNPPAIPQGHVSVNDNPAVANPARAFANQIADIARNNPATFNDDHIVGVHLTDDECRDKPKWLNQ